MRYIKTFFDKFKKKNTLPEEEVLYKTFDLNHIQDAYKNIANRMEDFSKSEFLEIFEFITDNLKLSCEFEKGFKKDNEEIKRHINKYCIVIHINRLSKTNKIKIMKFKDEWYTVWYYRKNQAFNLVFNPDRIDKCDTLEGVKQSLLNFNKQLINK